MVDHAMSDGYLHQNNFVTLIKLVTLYSKFVKTEARSQSLTAMTPFTFDFETFE